MRTPLTTPSPTARTRYLAGAASVLAAVAMLAGSVQMGTAAAAPASPASPAAGSSPVVGAPAVDPATWAPVLADDFNGTTVNTGVWQLFNAPTGQRHHVTRNVVEANGMVSLKTIVNPTTHAWTTAGMCACKATTQTYGRYDMRMRLSSGDSRAVALLWGANSWPPEMDFAEFGAGNRQQISQTVHYGTRAQNLMIHNFVTVDMRQWHTVTLEWSPGRVQYYLDGRPTGTVTSRNVPNVPMWLGLVTSNQKTAAPTQSVDFDIDGIAVYSYLGGSTPGAAAPAAPTTVGAVAGVGSAAVSWTASTAPASAPVTSYTVTAAPGGATATVTGTLGQPPATTATVGNLTPGTAYTFTVTATNRAGTSPASAPSSPVTVSGGSAAGPGPSFTTAPTPSIIRGVVGSTPTSSDVTASVRFAASGPSPVCSYRLQRSTAGGPWTDVQVLRGATSAKDPLPAAGSTVQYQAQATDCSDVQSAWTPGPALTYRLTPDTDRGVVYAGHWTAPRCAACLGGLVHRSSSRGDSVTVTLANAASFGVVATVGPQQGGVKVYVDGVFVANAATHAVVGRARQLVYLGTFATPGPHTVTVVNAGSPGHNTVDLDGVVSLG